VVHTLRGSSESRLERLPLDIFHGRLVFMDLGDMTITQVPATDSDTSSSEEAGLRTLGGALPSGPYTTVATLSQDGEKFSQSLIGGNSGTA